MVTWRQISMKQGMQGWRMKQGEIGMNGGVSEMWQKEDRLEDRKGIAEEGRAEQTCQRFISDQYLTVTVDVKQLMYIHLGSVRGLHSAGSVHTGVMTLSIVGCSIIWAHQQWGNLRLFSLVFPPVRWDPPLLYSCWLFILWFSPLSACVIVHSPQHSRVALTGSLLIRCVKIWDVNHN